MTSIQEDWCHIKKFVGRQHRANFYGVKINECDSIPSDVPQRNKAIHVAQEDVAEDYMDFREAGCTSEPVTISPTSPEDGTLAPYQEAAPDQLPVLDALAFTLEDEVCDMNSLLFTSTGWYEFRLILVIVICNMFVQMNSAETLLIELKTI